MIQWEARPQRRGSGDYEGDYQDYHANRNQNQPERSSDTPWTPTEATPMVTFQDTPITFGGSSTFPDTPGIYADTLARPPLDWTPTSPVDATQSFPRVEVTDPWQNQGGGIDNTMNYEHVRAHTAMNQREVTDFAREYGEVYQTRLDTYHANLRRYYGENRLDRNRIQQLWSDYNAGARGYSNNMRQAVLTRADTHSQFIQGDFTTHNLTTVLNETAYPRQRLRPFIDDEGRLLEPIGDGTTANVLGIPPLQDSPTSSKSSKSSSSSHRRRQGR